MIVIAAAGLAHADWDIVSVDYPGAQGTVIGGINSAGQIAGGTEYYDALFNPVRPYQTGFLYDPKRNAFTALQPAGYFAQAFAISDSGMIVGSATADPLQGGSVGFILDKGTYTLIAHPGYALAALRGVGNTGSRRRHCRELRDRSDRLRLRPRARHLYRHLLPGR